MEPTTCPKGNEGQPLLLLLGHRDIGHDHNGWCTAGLSIDETTPPPPVPGLGSILELHAIGKASDLSIK